VNGLPLTVIGLHLLAFPEDPERRAAREAQAEVVRRLAAGETREGRLVLILGDLNDYDGEVEDAAGNVPITRVLEILRRLAVKPSRRPPAPGSGPPPVRPPDGISYRDLRPVR
jgi:endonuclease/exonuclease/phosphatase family metal-dependent hydrolase